MTLAVAVRIRPADAGDTAAAAEYMKQPAGVPGSENDDAARSSRPLTASKVDNAGSLMGA